MTKKAWFTMSFVRSENCFFGILQRNHTLFGSVVSAMAGVRPILPFLARTQSLKGSKGHQTADITPVIAVSTAATKMLGVSILLVFFCFFLLSF